MEVRTKTDILKFIDSIEFNNFFIRYFFNCMIKIYGHEIQHQPKNKNLFETMITLNKI